MYGPRDALTENPRNAQSCKGVQGDPLKGLKHSHREVFKSALEAEELFADEWACFYHSYNHPALVYEVQAAIAKLLFGFAAECSALPRLLQDPFKNLPDAPAVLKAFPQWTDQDHNPAFKSVGICCSTSLVSQDPEATPTEVFAQGYAASRVDSTKIVEKLLQAFGVKQNKLTKTVEAIRDLAVKYGLPQVGTGIALQGHLLQIFIHRSCVDHLAYASHPFGVLDTTRHPLSKSLASSCRIAGQARLVVNPREFMQTDKVNMFTYSADELFHSQRSLFQDALCKVLSHVIQGAHMYTAQGAFEGANMYIGQAEIEDLCLCIANSDNWEAEVLVDVQAALKESGYTDEELPTALKDAGYSASDLNMLGYSAGALQKAGYSLASLLEAGYQDAEVLEASYSDAEVLSGGFSATDLKNLGYSASSLKEVGYSAHSLNNARYALASLIAAGYADSALLSAGFKASDLREAGYSAAALRSAGYTDDALITVGYSVHQLHGAGCTANSLQKAGFTARALQEAGYTATALRNASYTEADILRAGYAVEALRAADYSVADLRKAGYAADAMQMAGISATALRMAGYMDTEIRQANYTDAALQAAGCSLGTHQDTSKAIAALWCRSLAKVGQDIDDMLIDFLTTAALDAADEEDLAQLLEDYVGEPCSDTLQDFLAMGLGAS